MGKEPGERASVEQQAQLGCFCVDLLNRLDYQQKDIGIVLVQAGSGKWRRSRRLGVPSSRPCAGRPTPDVDISREGGSPPAVPVRLGQCGTRLGIGREEPHTQGMTLLGGDTGERRAPPSRTVWAAAKACGRPGPVGALPRCGLCGQPASAARWSLFKEAIVKVSEPVNYQFLLC